MTELIEKDGTYYTLDTTSYPIQIGDHYVAYTLDYFAYVDANGNVYTIDGEDTVSSSPVIAAAAVNQAQPLVNGS